MRLPRPGWQLPVTVLLAGAVLLGRTVAAELIGNALAAVRWVAGSVIGVAGLAWLVQWRLRRRAVRAAADPTAARPGLPVPLPAAPELVGRDDLLAAAVELARHAGVLLLHGPRGIGTSALARAVAHRLSAEGAYADLRPTGAGGPESPARSRIRVLAALGLLPPRAPTAAVAYEQVAAELRDTGRVLLVDNADTAEQLDWLVRPIPGAYVLAAGDVPPWAGEPDLPELAVGPLAPEHGLALLRAAPAVADRAQPGRSGVNRLARAYLKNPAAVLSLRSWLAANPQVPISALVADLDGRSGPGGPTPELLQTVFRLQTRGLSAPAHRLLGLLPEVPLTRLSDAAVGALLGRGPAAGQAVAAELARAGLLVTVSPSRYDVPREARTLGLPAPDGAPAALARLVTHYAGDSVEWLVALTGPTDRAGRERDAEAWFRREDLTLLALLERPGRVPRSAAARLALIADALDAWFVRDGRPADRRAAAEAALAVAADLGDAEGELTARLRLAATARAQGELDEATEHLRAARELGGAVDDPRLITGLGQQALAVGDVAGARQEFERNLSRRPRRDAVGRVIDQVDLGAAAVGQGDLDLAERRLQEAAVLAQDAGDLAGVAYAQELLGVVAARRGEPAAALAVWAEAQLLFEQRHDDQGQARCLLHRATLLAGPEPATAQRMLRASLALRGTQTTGVGVALAHLQLAGHVEAADPAAGAAHRAGALAALAPWEGRIDPPADVAALRRQLTETDRSP